MSNFNNTGEVKEISILDMMNGAIGERAAYELTRIMKNCRDFNTEAKKARTLTIKLSPVKPIDGALLLGGTDADPIVMEYTPQVPGQQSFDPAVDTEPKVVKLA